MRRDWQRLLRQIESDRRSGASTLVARGIEAARLFLSATRHLSPARLDAALERFTLHLTASQPSMAPLLTLANALWLGRERNRGQPSTWAHLHDTLVEYADGVDRSLRETVRRAAVLVRPDSVVLTYSHSTAVRLALWRAMATGRRFEVVCSESRPIGEGVDLARRLAGLGIPTRLVVDAALAEWVGRADLVLLGADAITPDAVVNKVGSEPLLQAARRANVAAFVLADSSKWLPEKLTAFWRMREEAPQEITRFHDPNLVVHNRYYDNSPMSLVTGLVWEDGVARPSEIKRRLTRLPVAEALVRLLGEQGVAGPGT
jgi:translation initiation factor 2B subunit (eIF-2B alpha/beta/delta family)